MPPLEAQEASFQKKFENFLHNAITIPKCAGGRAGRGGAGGQVLPRVGCAGCAWLWVGLEAVHPVCNRDRALPGLPRSPWKVTSINKSPQR